ncbi:MAG TPA: hypothetical protein VI197_17615 [Polyangiaceae bacterium]
MLARSRHGLRVLGLLLALTLPAGAQTDTQRAAARSAAQAGDKAFKEQRYEEAALYFARAEAIMHAPTLLLFLARSQAKLGQYVQARESYIKILREELAPDAPAAFVAAKQSADAELPQVAAQIATLTLDVPGVPVEGLRISIDDEPVTSAVVGVPYPIDPGDHRVAAGADGYEPAATRVGLSAGETREVTLTLHRIATAHSAAVGQSARSAPGENDTAARDAGGDGSGVNGMRVAGYVSLGVGVVGVGLGTLLAVQFVQARDAANDAWAECLDKSEQGCDDDALEQETLDLDDEASAKGTQAWIAYGVGAAGLATGIALLALGSDDGGGEARVTPYATANGFGVVGQF